MKLKNVFSKKIINSISRFVDNIYKLSWIKDDEFRRKTLILNTILTGFLILAVLAQFTWIWSYFINRVSVNHTLLYTITPSFFIILTLFLFFLSTKGFYKLSACILIILLLAANINTTILFGENLPASVATYALILSVTGLVLGSSSSVILMIFIFVVRLTVFCFQDLGMIQVQSSWRQSVVSMSDVIIINFIYLVVAITTWISSRELKKSFDLIKEQNENLEKTVDERTKELREYQLKQLMKINTLAEFGKLSAGLLHDIKSPLTVISMNLDSIKDYSKYSGWDDQVGLTNLVKKSLMASKTIESIMRTSQKQLVYEDKKVWFDLKKEIKNTLLLLDTRANKLAIQLKFSCSKSINFFGNPAEISRVVANLVMNSIDSYGEVKRSVAIVNISLKKIKKTLLINIKDNGCGIRDENKDNIFQPMFSTKKGIGSAGLGLFISETIIKNCFKGGISFKSVWGEGSEFLVEIPILNQYGTKNSQNN